MTQSTKNVTTHGAAALRDALDGYTNEGGHVTPDGQEPLADGVTFDGRQYRYETYRYDRRDDAVAYAELMRERRDARGARAHAAPSRPSSR